VEPATPDQSFACQAVGLGKAQNNALEQAGLTACVILSLLSSSGCRKVSERVSYGSTVLRPLAYSVREHARQRERIPRDVHGRRRNEMMSDAREHDL
jgi:hypothetical protein